ncbi:helix-turn-helix domain-containing protein, partial [Lactobacillus crispatus]
GIKNTKGVFNKLSTSNISSNTFNSNTVSNSSSAKKEEDPEREKIYKEFFTIARMNDKLKNHSTNPTLDELKQLRGLLYQCNVDTLQAVKDKFKERMSWDMVGKPYSYLLKMLRDGLANDRNYESWG